MSQIPSKEIVFIGGGHSHAIALRHFGENPIPGVRLTLITDALHAPYSGMLPGHIAGFYSFEQAHIDLYRLCEYAGVQLYRDSAIGLDLSRNQVLCANRPPVSFDLVSIDIGSTPNQLQVPGAQTYAIPAKPVSQFLDRWRETIEAFARHPTQPLKLAIVGGGAGGVELALTMQQGLFVCRQARGGMRNIDSSFVMYTASFPEIHLFHRGQELMSSHNPFVRKRLTDLIVRRDIQLHLNEQVTRVSAEGIECESGLKLECDKVFWVTQASAPDWLNAAGLATDRDGFILVKDSLQSISHPQVFAAGDIATMVNYTRPKAGVFAVRQGKPLYENIRQAVLGQPAKPYRPQPKILGLIGTGDGSAIASWGKWGLGPNPVLWRWKDWIDRKFMDRFVSFPTSTTSARHGQQKNVSPDIISSVLQRLQTDNPKIELLIPCINNPDNVAIESVTPGILVQSVETLEDPLRDPYQFGILSIHHGLNSLLAKGATPQSLLAAIQLPSTQSLYQEETLYQLLSGMVKALGVSQTQLVGYQVTTGRTLSVTLSSRGYAYPEQLWDSKHLQPGQVLILTKPLGTGTLFAAHQQYRGQGRWLQDAIASMMQSNYPAAVTFMQMGATACRAIGSSGLLQEAVTMVGNGDISLTINLDRLPVLEGAIETSHYGLLSPLHAENSRSSQYASNASSFSSHPLYSLLFDPQSSGGLLASVPSPQGMECLKLLQDLGYIHSAIIGEVNLPSTNALPIKLEVNEELTEEE